MSLLNVVRWIHIISGVSWLGEVLTINFVLLPALMNLDHETRVKFIRQVFPRVFRLASALSLTSILSGAVVNYLMTDGWKNWGQLIHTRWGIGILVGGGLGLALALFHFFAEGRFEPIALSVQQETKENIEKFIAHLKLIPRVGMMIIVSVIVLMMYAARGV